jgi:hypothetical protein
LSGHPTHPEQYTEYLNIKIMHTASIMKIKKEIKLISAWQHLQFNKKSKIKKLATQ